MRLSPLLSALFIDSLASQSAIITRTSLKECTLHIFLLVCQAPLRRCGMSVSSPVHCFLRKNSRLGDGLKRRHRKKTKHLIDVLVTQHSRWVASRMRRAIFGQATSTAVETCDHNQQQLSSQCARTAGVRAQPVKNSSRNTAGSMRRLKAAFSNSIETPKVGSQIGKNENTRLRR